MNTNLCDRFTALTPFTVRKETFHEVILLYIRLVKQRERKQTAENMPKNQKPKEGSFIIGDTLYSPAQNDDWW